MRKIEALVVAQDLGDLPNLLGFLSHYLCGIPVNFYPAVLNRRSGGAPGLIQEIRGEVRNELSNPLHECLIELDSSSEERPESFEYVFGRGRDLARISEYATYVSKLKGAKTVDVDWERSAGVEGRLTSIAGDIRGLTLSQRVVERLSSELRELKDLRPKALLVGTGPSSREVLGQEVGNDISIVANTVIFDDKLMEHLKPRFLTFSDPAYHMGPTKYAETFRRKVAETLCAFPDLNVLTLRKHHKALESLIPETKDRLFSVEQGSNLDSPLNLDIDLAPIVRPYPNILTLLMLPLAATFAQAIELFGFDGRKQGDKGFWSHGKSVQQHSLLDECQKFHSGFHSINFETYSLEHERQVGEMLAAVEAKGISVRVKSKSSIPALGEREDEPAQAPIRATKIVVLAPDWRGDFGHYRPWNTAIREASQMQDCEFEAWVSQRFGGRPENWIRAILPPGSHLRSGRFRLRHQFWTVFEGALASLSPDDICTIFMYEGRLADAPTLARLARKFPKHRFVFNIFWRPTSGELKRVERCSLPENLLITADNQDLLLRISQTGSLPRLLPFFPPNFPVAAEKRPNSRTVRRIAWMTTPYRAKGIHLLPEFVDGIEDLLRNEDVELTVRIPGVGIDAPEPDPLLEASLERAIELGVKVVDSWGNYDSNNFNSYLAQFDLVVLPYPGLLRTSGLALDALLAGTAVLTLEDNWISRLGISEKAVITVSDAPEAIPDMVRHLVKSGTKVGPSLLDQSRLRRRYTVDNLLNFLLQPLPSAAGVASEWNSAFREIRRRQIRRANFVNSQTARGLTAEPVIFDEVFPYRANAAIREEVFLRALLADSFAGKAINIVDVGAGNGSFFNTFAAQTIQHVYAIEPHPARANGLREKFGDSPRISILETAISAGSGSGYSTLYDSDESWGVSTLNPWLESHRPGHVVRTLRLADLKLPKRIDILKVDTEGNDLEVLESLDWTQHDVGVVMAEFDAQKDHLNGATSWEAITRMLEKRGFTTFLSEWYPIERYGQKHKWRCLNFSKNPAAGSWGNVIGIRGLNLTGEDFSIALSRAISVGNSDYLRPGQPSEFFGSGRKLIFRGAAKDSIGTLMELLARTVERFFPRLYSSLKSLARVRASLSFFRSR